MKCNTMVSLINRYITRKRAAITMPGRRMVLTILSLLLSITAPAFGAQAYKVDDSEIVFGQSAAFSGPASRLGINMRAGILAAFYQQNDDGGVHGRTLKLVSYNDSYEPNTAIANVNRLIETDKVFALIGTVGTPTSIAVAPIAQKYGIPFFGPFTGAGALRSTGPSVITNLRASYAQETEFIVNWLVAKQKQKRISVLYQDDSFGKTGLKGVNKALSRRGLKLASSGAYERNTVAVKRALLEIKRGEPDAVILVSAYEPAATFIKWAQKLGVNTKFICLSFVGTNALSTELRKGNKIRPDTIFVSQVVPNVTDQSLPVIAEYTADMNRYFPRMRKGFVSLEGYLVGRTAIAFLKRAGRDLDRAAFLKMMSSGEYDLSGFKVNFDGQNNQGSNQVFLTALGENGAIKTVNVGQ
jgi:ABC-type branched-subunit amino acid transport system substrate-binding protein